MELDFRPEAAGEGAMASMAPGPLLSMGRGRLSVEVAPEAGGRIARIGFDGVDWLVPYGDGNEALIAWGSYPMLPWAGRLRGGAFEFEGRRFQLQRNLGHHAIHGLGFALPWQVDTHSDCHVEMSLALPRDTRWPFGGHAWQRIETDARSLRMSLSLIAGDLPMPGEIGWHPWFLRPDALGFSPAAMYRRDAEGIAVLPLTEPAARPWDDCFINHEPVLLERAGQRLRLSSDCPCWVVFDELDHATCVEPQSGPADAFNIAPRVLPPHAVLSSWFRMEWL